MRFLILLLVAGTLVAAPATNRLERAVRDGKKIHERNPNAAKPGDRPDNYGSPGRGHDDDKPGNGPKKNPPGQNRDKKP